MPDRLYIPAVTGKPTIQDRLRAHTPELILCAVSAVLGTLVIVGAFIHDFDPSPSIAELYPGTAMGVGGSLLVGSTVWGRALLTTYTYADQAWARIRVGSGLFATGWLLYAVTCFLSTPGAIFPWAIGSALAGVGYWYLITNLHNEDAMKARRRCRQHKPGGGQ